MGPELTFSGLAMSFGLAPKKTDYVMLTIAFVIMSLIIGNHNHNHRGQQIDYLELDAHLLISLVLAITAVILFLEGVVVNEGLVIMAFLRCASTVWTGVWILHVGFKLYTIKNEARTDNVLLEHDHVQEMADFLTCIGYLVASLFFVAFEGAVVYMVHHYWRKREEFKEAAVISPVSKLLD